jgi:hypothetical protein
MSHPKQSGAATRRTFADEACTNPVAAREWEADTDVMPPEYCRQLLEISRRLQHAK